MKYGLNKYLFFLDTDANSIEGRSKINFLRTTLDRLEFDDDPDTNVGEKVIRLSRVKTICSAAEAKDSELGLFLKMMYETGTRASGMKLLLWKDVHREAWQGEPLAETDIFIDHRRSKSKNDGVVTVSDATYQRLEQVHAERDPAPEDLVFFPDLKRDSVYKKVWRFFDQNFAEETPHYFRHSRLTHLAMQMYEEDDLNYATIKERLRNYARHESAETTELYIELAKQKIQQRSGILENHREVDWS
jgi:integrase